MARGKNSMNDKVLKAIKSDPSVIFYSLNFYSTVRSRAVLSVGQVLQLEEKVGTLIRFIFRRVFQAHVELFSLSAAQRS